MKFTNRNTIRQILFAAFSMLCFAMFAAAQTETARIQGTVTDAAGAVVSGATIKVSSVGTGREVTVTSSQDGTFSVLTLQPGRYTVDVTAPNFKTTRQEITLEVAQTAPLNVALEAGAVTETVTVTTDVPQVEATTSAVGETIQGRQITELPLNGRNVIELARLTPGVTQGVVGGFASGAGGDAETYRGRNTGGASLSVNGQRTQANNFLLDGVDNNESLVNTINIFPSADAVQEFRVQTSVAPAEFGRGGGAIINTVTRSGRNDIFGSAYTFIRNDNLDARRTFEPTKPEFRRGQFGGTVGGPVIKDYLFFFASYEGLRQFLPVGTDQATVPTAAFRSGDFSLLLDPVNNGYGRVIQLRDPRDGSIIPGNRLDLLGANRLNAAALAYLNAFPLPNRNSTAFKNYENTRVQIDDQDVVDFRFDGNLTEADQLFVRGNWGKYSQEVTSRLPTLPSGFGSGSNPTRTKGLVIGWNKALTSTIFNELRVQGNRLRYGYEPPFGDQTISADLGIVNANRDESLGGGALIGGYNDHLEYTGDFGPYRVPQTTLQLVDSLSFAHGNHTLKFGGSIIHREVSLFRPLAGKGDFRMYGNGDFTQCPGGPGAPTLAQSGTTGFEQADLLIGFMCRYEVGFQGGPVGTRNWENALFIQDDWRVTRKLTLNLGLRYELFTNPTERYARQANFDLETGSLVLAEDGGDSLTETDKNNWSPRLGFAYDIFGNGRTVFRGGYGLFYFLDRGGISNQLAQNPPFAGSLNFSYNDGYRVTFTGQAPLNSTDNTLATLPLPLPLPNTDPAFLNNPLNANVIAVRPDNEVSQVHQFNVQVQHQLTDNTALSVGYVGTRGRNLILYYNLNGTAFSADTAIPCPVSGRTLGACYPGLGSVNVRDDIGESSYDSLQIQLDRRFTRGWQYIASYTLSKTKDNGNGAFDNPTNGVNYVEDFGTSRLDYPHVFSFETIYELPFGRGRSYGGDIPKALDYVVGGWQINSIFRAQSGSAFDVRKDNRLVNLDADPYTGERTPFLDRSAFSIPASGIGSLERNSLRSPSTYNLNLGLAKDFVIVEDVKLQFRMEAFNIFNTIQWGTPNTNVDDARNVEGFGFIRNTAPFSNRQIQFGLRLTF